MKKGRGGGKLPQGWDDQEFTKLQVSLSVDGSLIGDDVIAYSSACGVLARTTTRLPLTYKSWRAVPKAQKEEVWKEIQVMNYKIKYIVLYSICTNCNIF